MAGREIFTSKEATEILASKDEDMRRRLLSERLERIIGMPEDERIAALEDMLNDESDLTDEDRVKVVKTRMDILIDMPEEKRDILISALKKVMSAWTFDRKLMEEQALEAAVKGYTPLKKLSMYAMLRSMLA
ncbi:MAG: hypothetical protein OIN66_09520 [Candidatus Methanoperedens sp.]|nr:hypothetical protein [Candidatus Methanoperedens sp.]